MTLVFWHLSKNIRPAADKHVAETVLSVSRSTYNSYVKGSSHCVPDAEQLTGLRGLVLADLNPLLEALAIMDGTEPAVMH